MTERIRLADEKMAGRELSPADQALWEQIETQVAAIREQGREADAAVELFEELFEAWRDAQCDQHLGGPE
jgi:hypothetical protein